MADSSEKEIRQFLVQAGTLNWGDFFVIPGEPDTAYMWWDQPTNGCSSIKIGGGPSNVDYDEMVLPLQRYRFESQDCDWVVAGQVLKPG